MCRLLKFSFVHTVSHCCCWTFTWGSKTSDTYENFLSYWEVCHIHAVNTNSCQVQYWSHESWCYLQFYNCSVKSIRTCYPQDGAAAGAAKTSRIEMLFANKVCTMIYLPSVWMLIFDQWVIVFFYQSEGIVLLYVIIYTVFTISFCCTCSFMLLWSMRLLKMLKRRYVCLTFLFSCAFPPLVH